MPGGLVDHEDVVVLVHDAQRDRLGRARPGRRRNLDVDHLAAAQAIRTASRRPVDAHEAAVDQSSSAARVRPAALASRRSHRSRRVTRPRHASTVSRRDVTRRSCEAGAGAPAGRESRGEEDTPTVIAESATLNAGQCQRAVEVDEVDDGAEAGAIDQVADGAAEDQPDRGEIDAAACPAGRAVRRARAPASATIDRAATSQRHARAAGCRAVRTRARDSSRA